MFWINWESNFNMKGPFFLLLALIFLNTPVLFGQEVQELAPAAFSAKIKANPKCVVVDVRSPDEFKSGSIDRAINIDVNGTDFDASVKTLDKNKTILVYCLAGVRSKKAATILQGKGFKVYSLEGGIKSWSAQGLPVVKQSSK